MNSQKSSSDKFTHFLAIAFSMIAAILAFMLVYAAKALADVDPTTVVIPDSQFLLNLIQSFGGLKGAGGLAIAYFVVQTLMQALQTTTVLKTAHGAWRLITVVLLSLVSGVIALRIQGVPLAAALFHAQTLAAYSVLMNQIYKQFFVKEA